MVTAPTRPIYLTDEKWDRLITLLNNYCQRDMDAEQIAAEITTQQNYSPTDIPVTINLCHTVKPPSREFISAIEEAAIKITQTIRL